MSGKVVRLVPKIEPENETAQVTNAIEAVQLALDTLKGYCASKEARPNKVIVMLCSDDKDGIVKIEYVTANLGHFALLGMIDTIKDEIMQERRG